MTRVLIIAVALWIIAAPAEATTKLSTPIEAAPSRVYALVVANNGSLDADIAPLRFADDDGVRWQRLLERYAVEVQALYELDADTRALHPGATSLPAPTLGNLRAAMARLSERIEADRERGLETELIVVLVGHGSVAPSGEGYLHLRDARLTRARLRELVIDASPADFTHLLIDACNSYTVVHERGGGQVEIRREDMLRAFAQQLALPPGVGVVLSTSSAGAVHEWEDYGAGIFGHQLRSALAGAGEVSGDGRVSYYELRFFVMTANAAIPNPRLRVRPHIVAPSRDRGRPFLDLRRVKGPRVSFAGAAPGHYEVRDGQELRYADLHTSGGELELVLGEQVPYRLIHHREGEASMSAKLLAGVPVRELRFDAREGGRGGGWQRQLFERPFGSTEYAAMCATLEGGCPDLGESVEVAQADARGQRGGEVGWLRVLVEPAGAAIHIDGRYLGRAPLEAELPLRADVDHRIAVKADGHHSSTRQLRVRAEEHSEARFLLQPRQTGVDALAWTLAGTGVAMLASGGALTGLAQRDSDAHRRGLVADSQLRERALLRGASGLALMITGGALLGLAAWRWWPESEGPENTVVAPVFGPEGGGISVRINH